MEEHNWRLGATETVFARGNGCEGRMRWLQGGLIEKPTPQLRCWGSRRAPVLGEGRPDRRQDSPLSGQPIATKKAPELSQFPKSWNGGALQA